MTGLLSSWNEEPEALASRLLYRFGSIGRIAQASESELRQVANEGEGWVETLLMVRRLIYDGLREDLRRTKLGSDRQALHAYLLATMQNLAEERMLAILADADGFVIAEEIIAEGEAGHVQITPRRIFGRALKLDARRIVLVHNHPSGCAAPSKFDIDRTLLLVGQAKSLGLSIDDHLIVGARRVTSMKDGGFM